MLHMTNNQELLQPISDASPCGENAQYHDDYDAIEQEFSKQNSLYGGSSDWKRIQTQAIHLLSTTTKDLKLICWLCEAQYKLEGMNGLLAGMELLESLSEKFWDNIYPAKDRSRVAALQFFFSKLDTYAEELLQQSFDIDQLTLLTALIRKLNTLYSDKLGNAAPSVLSIARKIETEIKRAEQTKLEQAAIEQPATPQPEPQPQQPPEPQPVPQPVVSQPPGQPTPQSAAPAPHVESPEEVGDRQSLDKALQSIKSSFSNILHYWQRSDDNTNPKLYKLSRTMAWITINNLPAINPDGTDRYITMLPPIPENKKKNFQARFNQGSYIEVLPDLELFLFNSPFWLDGHYLSWQCLTQLGQTEAAENVITELKALLQQLPELKNLQYSNRTPFADATTQEWITTTVLSGEGATEDQDEEPEAGEEPAEQGSSTQPAWDLAYAAAIEQAKNEPHGIAVTPLQAGLEQARDHRERYYWRMAIARFCLKNKKTDLALTLLTELDKELGQFDMTRWEPKKQIAVLRLLKRAWEQISPDKQDQSVMTQIKTKLCYLDISTVLH